MVEKVSDDHETLREFIHRALLKNVGGGQEDDLENSIRFDMADLLSSEFKNEIESLAQEIIAHIGLRRIGNAIAEQIKNTVSTVVANLLRAHALDPDCFVAISMGPQYYTANRYNCQGIGYANLRRTIRYMHICDPPLITYHRGFQNRQTGFSRSTRIQLTAALQARFSKASSAALFAIVPGTAFECIRLKNENKRLVGYEDNGQTNGMRARLERWNKFLHQQWTDLYVTDEQFKNLYKSTSDDEENDLDPNWEEQQKPLHVDLTRRRLYRVFNNGSFNNGGRFYGGWWQSVPSEWRQFITVNWYPARELDYSNMQPAMLYAKVGLPLESYAYEVDGVPQTEKNKKLIKKTFLQIINATKGMKAPDDKQTAELPNGWDWKQLREAIEAKHEPIRKFFRSGIGVELQRIDSDIAETVMLTMMEHGMLILPIHDSFIVRRGHHLALKDHMARAYKDYSGQDISISLDLSFADKLPAGRVVSTFEQMEQLIDKSSAAPAGYESYYERGRAFQAKQKREWFVQFNPYKIFR